VIKEALLNGQKMYANYANWAATTIVNMPQIITRLVAVSQSLSLSVYLSVSVSQDVSIAVAVVASLYVLYL